MKSKYAKEEVEGVTGGGGGAGSGYAKVTSSGLREGSAMARRENELANQVQRSIEERGGYPTRGGVPLKTKMQERMETRDAARQPPDYAKREARKAKFGIK